MIKTTDHINLLGLKGQDKVTKLKGVITSVSFELYGCIQVILTPESKDGEMKSSAWFDVTRIKILSEKPVMQLPDFTAGYLADGRKGGAEKPLL